MDPQNTIDQFFNETNNRSLCQRRVKNSVFLALQDDMKFTILLPGKYRPLELTNEQNKLLQNMLPAFTVIAQFCSAVDVIARVTHKQLPPGGQNGNYFREAARDWFELTEEEANELWRLRNGISHSYRLEIGQVSEQFGYNRIIRRSDNGHYYFYLHAMYTTLENVRRRVYDFLSRETDEEKQRTADYLTGNGFFFTLPPEPEA